MPADVSDRSPLDSPSVAPLNSSVNGPVNRTYDVVIVGGGIVGLMCASGLRDSGLRVAVIEAQTAAAAAGRQRAYAFSPVSAKILQGLGLWDIVGPQLTHFKRVKLSDGGYRKAITFRPQDGRADAVYYSAEHTVLMGALQAMVQAAPTIDYWCESKVLEVHGLGSHNRELRVERLSDRGLQQYRFTTQLVVGADGARSYVREMAGIKTVGWKYWQSCVTAVVEPEGSHGDTAYEKFWPSGPFAILPLPDNRCQIVWTAPHEEARAMVNLPKDAFLTELKTRYGDEMGDLKLMNKPSLFPVQLMQSREYVRPGIALIGDAAHCCHPVGGQGLNMGIRDATALAEILQQAAKRGEAVGSLATLKRYQRWRRTENWFTLTLTDFLNRAFSNRFLPLLVARRAGIVVLDTVVPLKRLILQFMTGFFGRLPAKAK
ncbi:MAG: FAD-dependent hydroxylase [Phormidesmis sp.]